MQLLCLQYEGLIFPPTFSASKYKATQKMLPLQGDGPSQQLGPESDDSRLRPGSLERPELNVQKRYDRYELKIQGIRSREFENSVYSPDLSAKTALITRCCCLSMAWLNRVMRCKNVTFETKHPSYAWNSSGHRWVSWIGRDTCLKSSILSIWHQKLDYIRHI